MFKHLWYNLLFSRLLLEEVIYATVVAHTESSCNDDDQLISKHMRILLNLQI